MTERARPFTPAVADLSVALVLHHLSYLELHEVQEEGLSEVLEGVGCGQVRDQAPLLQQQHREMSVCRLLSHTGSLLQHSDLSLVLQHRHLLCVFGSKLSPGG